MKPFNVLWNNGAGGSVPVASWFEVVLWTGTGSSSHTHSSLDLSDGGLVWVKRRDASGDHALYFKTSAGATVRAFSTNNTSAGTSPAATLDATGFTVPNDINGATYVAWVFKRSVGNFDLVNYTGNAANRSISHAMDSAPKLLFTTPWTGLKLNYLHHPTFAGLRYARLDSNVGSAADATIWNNSPPDSAAFYLGTGGLVNGNSVLFTAFLFGGGDFVAGAYTGTGAAQTIAVGFTPRFIILRQVTDGSWVMLDTKRSPPNWTGNDAVLTSDQAGAETATSNFIAGDPSGFQLLTGASNTLSQQYIYFAIR